MDFGGQLPEQLNYRTSAQAARRPGGSSSCRTSGDQRAPPPRAPAQVSGRTPAAAGRCCSLGFGGCRLLAGRVRVRRVAFCRRMGVPRACRCAGIQPLLRGVGGRLAESPAAGPGRGRPRCCLASVTRVWRLKSLCGCACVGACTSWTETQLMGLYERD